MKQLIGLYLLTLPVHPMLAKDKVSVDCEKNISFAVAQNRQIASRIPAFADKWVSKNAKKYPGLCFSQRPDPQAANYLLVFSTSQSAFNGIYPTVRTSTSTNTSTTPVSGSGTVTDNYGGMWNYTYNGTITTTTTTTTTTQENLPYTDTSNTLYLASYDQNGQLISERWRTVTTRQGGDGMNTLGYNLGAALGAIHMKEHLLKTVVKDVQQTAISREQSRGVFAPPPSGDPCSRLPEGANGCKDGKTVGSTINQSASTQREAYCAKYPRGAFPKPGSGWEYCDARDNPATQSAPAVAPAAYPAIATGTADLPKPCFTNKSGHTVCLAEQ